MTQKAVGLILILLLIPYLVFCQNDRFITISNVKARPLAMGGAFTSIEDDLAAINYNPAAFNLYRANKSHRITFFLNPIGTVIGAIENSNIYNSGGFNFDDFLLSLGLLVKSVFMSLNSFEVGFLLGEQGLNLPKLFLNEKVFEVSGFQQNHSHSVIGRLKLADKVSLGGSASLIYGSTIDDPFNTFSALGVSYGILLKPERGLTIGVSFINLPDSLHQFRMPLERFVDESVNIGVSYRLFSSTLFSLDVRNLGEEQQKVVREFHFGIEQVFLSQIAIRAGFYFKKDKGDHVISWGVGLLDGNIFVDPDNALNHKNFYFNYSFVYENTKLIDNRWHFLSLLIRI